ncbi:hypothetical protein NMY22_g11519 [Coprinellus aureogranulatus]|nr:hypothetical protein NMY22_g11519 [Coprinellus aureogranulatus]
MSHPQTQALRNPVVVSAICSHLSEGAHSEQPAVLPLSGLQHPTVSRQWKSTLALLIRVNRTFARACIPILWRTVDSLRPLIIVLGGDRTVNSDGSSYWVRPAIYLPLTPPYIIYPLQSFPHEISSTQWASFNYYTSNIKILVLGPEEQTLDVTWVALISTTIPQHISWFPAVKRLFLNSTDPFALFLSTSLMLHLRSVCLNLPSQTQSDLAILGAARRNSCLTGIRIDHLASSHTLRVLSELRHLKYLFVRIPSDTPTSLLVDSMKSLGNLRSLAIRQDPGEVGNDMTNPLFHNNGHDTAMSRPSRFPHLRWLSINANAAMQCVVAEYLAPTSLESLDIVVFSHKNAVWIEPVMTIYLHRNRALLSLKVEVMSDVLAQPEEISAFRGHHAFDSDLFLAELGRAHELRCLFIDNVPSFCKRITDHVLFVVLNLVHLNSLQFLPLPVTSLEKDRLASGNMGYVKQIPRYNPSLRFIETLLDVSAVPSLEADYDSDHRLEKLSIQTNGNPPKAIRDKLQVAKFLDAVFPYLRQVSSPIRDMEDGAESLVWGEVQEMVFSNQELRAGIWDKISGGEDVKPKKDKLS